MKRISILILVILALLVSGCSFNVDRNDDGSFSVESTLTQAQIETAIQTALANSELQSLSAQLQSGYIQVSASKARADSSAVDTLEFRLTLGVADGHLTAVISDLELDNFGISQAMIEEWNQMLADGLSQAGQDSPNSELESVSVSPEGVTMIWRVSKK